MIFFKNVENSKIKYKIFEDSIEKDPIYSLEKKEVDQDVYLIEKIQFERI